MRASCKVQPDSTYSSIVQWLQRLERRIRVNHSDTAQLIRPFHQFRQKRRVIAAHKAGLHQYATADFKRQGSGLPG